MITEFSAVFFQNERTYTRFKGCACDVDTRKKADECLTVNVNITLKISTEKMC